jgi:hypothetical protein
VIASVESVAPARLAASARAWALHLSGTDVVEPDRTPLTSPKHSPSHAASQTRKRSPARCAIRALGGRRQRRRDARSVAKAGSGRSACHRACSGGGPGDCSAFARQKEPSSARPDWLMLVVHSGRDVGVGGRLSSPGARRFPPDLLLLSGTSAGCCWSACRRCLMRSQANSDGLA